MKRAKPIVGRIRLQDIPLDEIENQIEQARIEERKRIGEWLENHSHLEVGFAGHTWSEFKFSDIEYLMKTLKQGERPKGVGRWTLGRWALRK